MTTLTVKEFGKRLKRLGREIEKLDVSLVAAKDMEGLMKQRIFGSGKATNQQKLGTYKSKQWKAKRKKKGRQTNYKDLEFSGALRESFGIMALPAKKEVAFGFSDNKFFKIAKGQEQQTGKIIFLPSDSEVAEVSKNTQAFLVKQIEKKLDRLF